MKRSGFARKVPPRPPRQPIKPLAEPALATMLRREDSARLTVEKDRPVRSEAYRRLVAALPCVACCREGNCQAAHPNTGKAKGMKADDRTCFALCGPRYMHPGCHFEFDQHQMGPREWRESVEKLWGRLTRAEIIAAGAWPETLPVWKEE